MADDATPARQRAANLARQEEVARLALDVAPGSDWADALAACGLLVPKKMARAAGIRALAAAGYDGRPVSTHMSWEATSSTSTTSPASSGSYTRRAAACWPAALAAP